jgi:hypothetical protein
MSDKINHHRRRFLGIAAMTIATTQLVDSVLPSHNQANAQPKRDRHDATRTVQSTDTTSILARSALSVPQADLDDLRRRIAATRWPDRETVPERSQGAHLDELRELVRYWGTNYDWRKTEAQFATVS